MKPFLKFGLRGYLGNLALAASLRVDQAVIGPTLGLAKLGLYAIAVTIATAPATFAMAIASRAFSRTAASDENRTDVASSYLRLTLIVALIGTSLLAVASPVFLPLLYGKAFVPALLPLLLLLPGTVFLCLSATAASLLIAAGFPGRTTACEVTGFVVAIGGLPIVIPIWGISGAATLSTVSYGISCACYLFALRRLGPVSVRPSIVEVRVLTEAIRSTTGRSWELLRKPTRRDGPLRQAAGSAGVDVHDPIDMLDERERPLTPAGAPPRPTVLQAPDRLPASPARRRGQVRRPVGRRSR